MDLPSSLYTRVQSFIWDPFLQSDITKKGKQFVFLLVNTVQKKHVSGSIRNMLKTLHLQPSQEQMKELCPHFSLAECPVRLVSEPDTWLAKMLCPMLLLHVVEAAIPTTPTGTCHQGPTNDLSKQSHLLILKHRISSTVPTIHSSPCFNIPSYNMYLSEEIHFS